LSPNLEDPKEDLDPEEDPKDLDPGEDLDSVPDHPDALDSPDPHPPPTRRTRVQRRIFLLHILLTVLSLIGK
jgi:hypothetical protein